MSFSFFVMRVFKISKKVLVFLGMGWRVEREMHRIQGNSQLSIIDRGVAYLTGFGFRQQKKTLDNLGRRKTKYCLIMTLVACHRKATMLWLIFHRGTAQSW